MRIELAQNAGFCFGVDRAVKKTYDLLAQGAAVCTLGPLIHNPQAVQDLQARGARQIENIAQVQPGETVVLRTHGVPKALEDTLAGQGTPVLDATCPFVRKIHAIVAGNEKQLPVLLAGDAGHPEVVGIIGHSSAPAYVFADAAELTELLKENNELLQNGFILVAQTTFQLEEWEKCTEIVNLGYTNAVIFDTICFATQDRQLEAQAMSKRVELMLIIGGKASSNTAKLRDVCAKNCPTYLIEDASGLAEVPWMQASCVGVTAGASTPAGIIKEVLGKMDEQIKETAPEATLEQEATEVVEEAPVQATDESAAQADAAAQSEAPPEEALPREITDDMDFSEALEVSLQSLNSDQQVKGIVMLINPSEIQVDIGRKQTGYVPMDEYSADPSADAQKELKVGDEIDLIIMKTNDAEGTIMLSKRRFDAMQSWNDIVEAEKTGEVLQGVVTDVIRGGVLALCNGVKVFIPASLATANRGDALEDLLHKEVSFRIIEVNRSRRRAVGSVRAVLKEQRSAALENFWSTAEEGQVFTGKVRSLTAYGAFVDLGGVDGMVHISELSWSRIKHPSEVVNVGDEIEVYIKALDKETKRISLGYKKTEDNPWEILRRDYPVDSILDAKIVGMTAFGAFANIIPGIDGLIHISQIANRHIEKPQDVLSVGDTVRVLLTAVDFDKKRVSLSIRALLDPMEKAEDADEPSILADLPDEQAPAAQEEAPAQEAPAEDAE